MYFSGSAGNHCTFQFWMSQLMQNCGCPLDVADLVAGNQEDGLIVESHGEQILILVLNQLLERSFVAFTSAEALVASIRRLSSASSGV